MMAEQRTVEVVLRRLAGDEATTIEPLAPSRIVCPACGAGQTHSAKGHKAVCLICGEPLPTDDGAAVVTLAEPGDPIGRPLIEAARKAIAEAVPAAFACEDLDDVLRAERRITSLFAFVPVWGLWQLSRSPRHTASQKMVIAVASLLVTVVLASGVVRALPNARSRAASKHAVVEASLRQLSALVGEYAREHGALPDAAAWKRSAEAGDLRFFDPWGRSYRYAATDGDAAVGTYGRDGALGGDGEDADLFIDVTRGTAESPPNLPPR